MIRGLVPSSINPNGDFEVVPRPYESISQIAWHPSSQYIAASSWDSTVRCWKVGPSLFETEAKAYIYHHAPALSTCFNSDGTVVYSGGCDNQALAWDLMANKTTTACTHSAPVKFVQWVADHNLLMTGSWDRSAMFLDPRSQNPAIVIKLNQPVYCGDVKNDLGIIASADREVFIFDLKKPQSPVQNFKSPLNHQTRCVSAFIDKKGFALASTEGRVHVSHIDPAEHNKNFTFKCHRDGAYVYAINDIDFHPRCGTFVTVGSDGGLDIWDKDLKVRVKSFRKASLPITCCKFSSTGSLLAYAVSYDWSKGASGAGSTSETRILIHDVAESEVISRPRAHHWS